MEEYLNCARSEIQLALARLRLGGQIDFMQRKGKRCKLDKVSTILHCFQCPGNEHILNSRGVRVGSEKRLVKIVKNLSTAAKMGIRDLINFLQVCAPSFLPRVPFAYRFRYELSIM